MKSVSMPLTKFSLLDVLTFGGLRPASTDFQCLLMLVLELAGDWVI